MILVDRITSLADDCISGESILTGILNSGGSQYPSASGDNLPIAWSIEVIAQLCAAFIGLTREAGGFSKGRLLKVRDAQFSVNALPLGEPLTITAHLESCSDQGIFIFSGSIAAGGQWLSRAGIVLLAQ